ncbi:LLM class flavin-dependent oxidoreductase [Gluconacetobacter tumulicola]|uniref:LLM class flavin-dependent oxidoreductase n=1 Tax=Gluconacetobacter tumulicola TaxID=1017177 RepID=A0A7W4JD27_9PROT|nr:LLM class flavin-dependent oxidoreductase [Gluconacetobacter tumulicola]MBB2178986.1 LLM class flavin-dependent oxidoreductase [Gluconacetobacter tumulicola]
MAQDRYIKLGFILHGVGRTWDDWRHPDRDIRASTNIRFYRQQAQTAERGKFDFLFVADSLSINEKSSPHYLNRFEPLTILSALAASTEHIGLVGTLSVSYSEPFNVARQFASLDHISGGRAGWNVVTSWLGDTAANFSRAAHPSHHDRYRIAAEHLAVVQGLWDSWEDDALVGDKAHGVFLDPAKLHRLDHAGPYFQVRGPLNIGRSRQGQPVIFQAGASEDGRDFAARHAEVVFCGPQDLEEAQAYYRDVKARAARLRQDGGLPLILPGIAPIVGRTDEDAEGLYQELVALTSLDTGLGFLSRAFSDHDFRAYDLDDPFPDVAAIGQQSNQSAAQRILARVRHGNLSIRQIARELATPRGDFVGGPQTVADALQRWVEQGGADGFNLFEPLPGQLEAFVDLVVPILQERGLLRHDYAHTTLRGNLGLSYPINRHAVDKKKRAG